MPLDVARLRDSDLAANESPEACWAAVQLWAASWHQIPAASIPNDDKWMAKATGYGRGVKDWMRVRVGALRGFVECTDGRLYHVVVAEKAREAWQAKVEQRYRTEVARVKKHNQRHQTNHVVPDFELWLSLGRPQGHHLSVPGDNVAGSVDNTGDKAPKRQGEGQGQGQGQGDLKDSGAKAPADKSAVEPKKVRSPEDIAKAELWRTAVSVLADGGCTNEDQARMFMGKLVADHTLPIVKDAVLIAVKEQPADARGFLVATCQRLAGSRVKTDIAHTTVPGRVGPDPELAKKSADRINAAKPNPDVLAQIAKIKEGAVA